MAIRLDPTDPSDAWQARLVSVYTRPMRRTNNYRHAQLDSTTYAYHTDRHRSSIRVTTRDGTYVRNNLKVRAVVPDLLMRVFDIAHD